MRNKAEEIEHNIRQVISIERLKGLLTDMLNSSFNLKQGYQLLSQYEQYHCFYINLLQISLSTNDDLKLNPNLSKLASASLLIFLRKNWSDNNYISENERKEMIQTLFNSIKLFHTNYFLKNYIAKLIGIIVSKEYPNCNDLLNVIIQNLALATSKEIVDMLLRILLSILTECDDRIGVVSRDVIPVVLQVFANSIHNQKNREKCLLVLWNLCMKLSHAEGTDDELLCNTLGANHNLSHSLVVFRTVLSTHPNMLFDLKRMTIKIIDLLMTDMPQYYSNNTKESIEYCFNTLINSLLFYTEECVLRHSLTYSQKEKTVMETEGHLYTRGYESDNENDNEKYGLEGLIGELLNLMCDSLSNSHAVEFLQKYFYHLMLIIKCYSLLSYSLVDLWARDVNEYIVEEMDYDELTEDKPLTIRYQCVQLLKSMASMIEPKSLLSFIKIVINELVQGINSSVYSDIVLISQYPEVLKKYYNIISDKDMVILINEANLLILGSLSEEIGLLIKDELISRNDMAMFINGLFTLISNANAGSNESNLSNITIGRAIWCIKQLLVNVFSDDLVFLKEAIQKVILMLIEHKKKADIGTQLIYCQTLFTLASLLKHDELYLENDILTQISNRLLALLKNTFNETMAIPLQTITALSLINEPLSKYIQSNYYKEILQLYLSNFNNPNVDCFVTLFKAWSNSTSTINSLFTEFIHLFSLIVSHLYPTIIQSNNKQKFMMASYHIKEISNEALFLSIMTMINALITTNHLLIESSKNEAMILQSILFTSEIILKSDDISIIHSCSLFLSSMLVLFKGRLSAEKSLIYSTAVSQVIMKLTQPNQVEGSAMYIGQIITLFYLNNENQIPPNIIERLMLLLYKTETIIIVQSIVVVIVRLIIKFPMETFTFLREYTSENYGRIPFLNILLCQWLKYQEMFNGNYVNGMTIKGLCILFGTGQSLIGDIYVSGWGTDSKLVTAPAKILFLLAHYLMKEESDVSLPEEGELCLTAIKDSLWDYQIKVDMIFII